MHIGNYCSKKRRQRIPHLLHAIRAAMDTDCPAFGTAKHLAWAVSDLVGEKKGVHSRTIVRDIKFLNECGARISCRRVNSDDPFYPGIFYTYTLADPEWDWGAVLPAMAFLHDIEEAIKICRDCDQGDVACRLEQLGRYLLDHGLRDQK